MQVVIVLHLELEGHVRCLEKRQIGAVAHFIERMQRGCFAPAFGFVDLQGPGKRQAKKALVEPARLFRVATAICIVVQPADHGNSPRLDSGGDRPL